MVEKRVYKCPEGTTVSCPGEYSVDSADLTTGCLWSDETDPPLLQEPLPMCQPNEARTVYISDCLDTEVTIETCENDVLCEVVKGSIVEGSIVEGNVGADCKCPDGVGATEVRCSVVDESVTNVKGYIECVGYGAGYMLACPDAYLLNEITQLCEQKR